MVQQLMEFGDGLLPSINMPPCAKPDHVASCSVSPFVGSAGKHAGLVLGLFFSLAYAI